MQTSSSYPSALGSRISNLFRSHRVDTHDAEPDNNTNMLSHTLKSAKADLRKRFNLSKDKSWTRLNESKPAVSSEGTISSKSTKRSLLNIIFETKSGRKLHKRARSDPTPQGDGTDQLPELELVLQPHEDARVFSVGTNQALDDVYTATVTSREYYTCSSGSYDTSYEIDEWSISDHGTVLIRRPAGFHLTRSPSLMSCATHHTIYEETPTTETEADGAHDNEPIHPVQEPSGTHNTNVGSSDDNIPAGFTKPISMAQVNRTLSNVIVGRTKKSIILRPIKELRRMRKVVSGSSKKIRKTEHDARRLFLAGNDATTTATVDEHHDTTRAPQSIHESHDDDHDAIDGTHVDDETMSQTQPGEEPFHQRSTHEFDDNESIDSIQNNLTQCNIILAAYQGEYNQLQRTNSTHTDAPTDAHTDAHTDDLPDTIRGDDAHTDDLPDTIRGTNDVESSDDKTNLNDARPELEFIEFAEEMAALEKYAQACNHWGDPSINSTTLRQGFNHHLEIWNRTQSRQVVNNWVQDNSDRFANTNPADAPSQPTNPPVEQNTTAADNIDRERERREELTEAFNHPQARHVAGVHPHEAIDELSRLLTSIDHRNEEETRIDRDIEQTRERIDARSGQLEHFYDLLRQLREQNEAKAALRRQEIYHKASQTLKRVGAALTQVMARCEEKRELYRDLLYREKALVDAIQDDARRLGLGNHTPNELVWAVEQMVAGDSLEYVEESLNSCF
ncbi:hypothetical protein NCS52_00697000 [Fusarium sp. LHS14.1]|nr:hypothetical protein NCS52_00697000 [Fusarium sp. LHS14.1]